MYLVRLGMQNHSGTAFRLHRVVGGASASIIMKLEHHIPVAGVCIGRGPYGGPASDSAAFTCRLRVPTRSSYPTPAAMHRHMKGWPNFSESLHRCWLTEAAVQLTMRFR